MLMYTILVSVNHLYFVTPRIIEKPVLTSIISNCEISEISMIKQLPWFNLDYYKQV